MPVAESKQNISDDFAGEKYRELTVRMISGVRTRLAK